MSGARRHGKGMRPAGGTRPFPQRANNELTDDGENTRVVSLSVEAEEFSLRTVPKIRVKAGAGSAGGGDCVPSRRKHGEIVGRCDAGVPTTAVAGAAALADMSGAAAPVDLAGMDVLAVARMKFSAVAEVHSLAVDDEGDPSVIRTIGQRSAVVLDPMAASRTDSGPMDEMSVLEPLEHSVLGVSLEGDDSCVNEVAVPNPLEHSGVGIAADVLSEMSVPEPLEHSVLEMPLEVGDSSVGSMTVPDPLEHSGVRVHADPLSANLPMIHSDESRNGRNGLRDHLCEDTMIQDIRTEVK